MKRIYLFPGQGSQFVGMGEGLFAKYAKEVRLASDVLGYAIDELCLADPGGKLNKTEFTQPALFFVNVLHYLQELKLGSVEELPQTLEGNLKIFAGHSLGEYCALFAAGAFDLETGLRLVQKRGALMSAAPRGAMAAIMDIDQAAVGDILRTNGMEAIDIANINSRRQTIISGLYGDIAAAEKLFERHQARFIPLNVSAAFHSRYMTRVAEEFAGFLKQFELHPLRGIVLANLTAAPYPKENYQELLIKQIDHAVLWYESISNVLAQGVDEFVETGPGTVLTRMCGAIKTDPLHTAAIPLEFAASVEKAENTPDRSGVYLMFAGQGTQYFGMGAELYRENATFREALDECDRIAQKHLGYSLVDEIYQLDAGQPFDHIRSSHPAVVSFGYSLYLVLRDKTTIAGVIGHSLGEYIAAIVAGVLSLEDGLEMVCIQSRLLEEQAEEGGLLSALIDQDFMYAHPDLFRNVHLAAVNSDKNIMFAGSKPALQALASELAKIGAVAVTLPVDYAFHSQGIDVIRPTFLRACAHIRLSPPQLRLVSAAAIAQQEPIGPEYFWRAIREPVNFRNLVCSRIPDNSMLVDMSATGSLSGFVRQCARANLRYTHVVNQFGNNVSSLNAAIAMLA